MKILINTPCFKYLGGVANHYLGLRDYWTQNVRYNTVGKRSLVSGSGKYWLPYDILKFLLQLLIFHPHIVVLNPSIGKTALQRDFIFLCIAHSLGFKVAVFIHGFNLEIAKTINTRWIAKHLNKSILVFVLAKQYKDKLREWGVHVPIELATTKVDDNLVAKFNVSKRLGKINNILFLARIVKAKGIYESIDTYQILKRRYPYLTLTIVGDGEELSSVYSYVRHHDIEDVKITGALKGKELIQEFLKADLYLFLSYSEGMPTSVLEAMAFGLPVITRKVGGLEDFFNDKMGYISDSYDPKAFADAIVPYIERSELTRNASMYNASYAREHFLASKVAKDIERTIEKYL